MQCLDISFNHLPVLCVFGRSASWASLPGLRELDVSGNAFRKLPDALGCFPSLRSLSLEYNLLTAKCLKPLSALPTLQNLSLAHNNIKLVPERVSDEPRAFQRLKRIDLSFNKIREVEGLRALEGLNDGVEVLIGDNPVAVKLSHRRIHPSSLPSCQPGAVHTSSDIYGPLTVNIFGNSSVPDRIVQKSTVTIKVKSDVPDRPSLAESLTCGLNTVRSSVADRLNEMEANAIKLESMTHSRIIEVFDQLQTDIDNWQHLAPVTEEAEERQETDGEGDLGKTFLTDLYVHEQVTTPQSNGGLLRHRSTNSSLGLQLDDFDDPSEQLAYQLGLDPLLLSHHTGLIGYDCKGSLTRLKFALQHPVTDPSAVLVHPNHQKLTMSAASKCVERKLKPLVSLPMPPSPLAKQVDNIEDMLSGMKSRILQVQREVAAQLETYEHLLDPLDREVDLGGMEEVKAPATTITPSKSMLAIARYKSGKSAARTGSSSSAVESSASQGLSSRKPSIPRVVEKENSLLKSAAASAVLGYS